jgi:hypothetical protein
MFATSKPNQSPGLRFGAMLVLLLVFGIGMHLFWEHRKSIADRTKCVSNLVRLRLAKAVMADEAGLKDGAQIELTVLGTYLSKPLNQYQCPSGGAYTLGDVGTDPVCSYSNSCFSYLIMPAQMRIMRLEWKHSLDNN